MGRVVAEPADRVGGIGWITKRESVKLWEQRELNQILHSKSFKYLYRA